jgi:hypothetical protein
MIMQYHIGWEKEVFYFIFFYLSISHYTVHKNVDSHASIQKDEDILLYIRSGQGTFTIKVVVFIL